MKAAVVSLVRRRPALRGVPRPAPAGDHDMILDVIAAGLHPRVRSQADGSHYTSTGELPLVPGIDGVGRGPDGLLRYFILPDTRVGAMAEQTVIDTRRSIVLPVGSDPIAVAAAMNPAMSSWIALRQRVPFQPAQDVLVLGATGHAGRWPSRSRGCSARARSSPPGAMPPGWPPCPPSAPPLPCRSAGTPAPLASSARPLPTSTLCSTTCGASPRPKRWPPSSPAVPIAASR